MNLVKHSLLGQGLQVAPHRVVRHIQPRGKRLHTDAPLVGEHG